MKGKENLLNKIRHHINRRLSVLFFSDPIRENKILFFSSRSTYDCNPAFIADELLKDPSCDLLWVYKDQESVRNVEFPKGLRTIEIGTLAFYKEAMSAKVWIDNAAVAGYTMLYKKKGQIMFQTWHGSLGIKRFDTSKDRKWIRKIRRSATWTDYIISNSDFETKLYQSTFWKDCEVLEYGHPRNDIFFNEEIRSKRIDTVRRQLQLEEGYHYCLYAPTFRDQDSQDPYLRDYDSVISALEKRFGGKWRMIVRKHFKTGAIRKDDSIIDASSYHDIQDLLCVCDAGITDYSSWICDFFLSGKPGFMYCSDLDSFADERGFLFPLNTLPFPISESEDGLINDILSFDEEKYRKDSEVFLRDKGCIEDGRACERTAAKVKEVIRNEK